MMGLQRRGDALGITWTDWTLNYIFGCSKTSPGCKFCWASDASSGLFLKGQAKHDGLTVIANGHHAYNGVLRCDLSILNQLLEKGEGRKVFVNSMSDTFHEKVPREWQDRLFEAMAAASHHEYQLLTKRPGVMLRYLQDRGAKALPVLPNVWLGFSAETQELFDQRWAEAKQAAALGWLVWVSIEPQLEKIALGDALQEGLAWVVTGGESTMPYSDARPYYLEWAESLIAECQNAAVPVFMKQMGVNPWAMLHEAPTKLKFTREGKHLAEWPEHIRVQQFPR